MGTPEIAVYSLAKIDKSKHEVVAIVTVPDKPSGRGLKLKFSAVKQYAVENEIKILQPEKLKDSDFINELRILNADMFVVLAFRMLPKMVWDMPPKGTINLHASLLPDYRGAAPINWAIINGEKKTGVTTFFIDEKIDTGKIIKQKEISILQTDNAGTLHDKIMIEGADLLLETMDLVENNLFNLTVQDILIDKQTELKAAPKIFKKDCEIDWTQNTENIFNYIRGLNPYPGAWTMVLKEEKEFIMKIFDVEYILEEHKFDIKSIIVEKNSFKIACKNGFVIVKTMQFQGKKRMKTGDFMRGFDISNCKLM